MGASSQHLKTTIFALLGDKCSQCGWGLNPKGFHICLTTGKTRKTETYMDFLLDALKSASAGEGRFAIWCSNCLSCREPVVVVPPVVHPPIALWYPHDRPTEGVIPEKQIWFTKQGGSPVIYEPFVLGGNGKVYSYNTKSLCCDPTPVAETWEEFAAAKGLPAKLPRAGTQIISPVATSLPTPTTP